MNILYEIGQQPGTNTIMLVPATLPIAGVSPVGFYGIQDLAKEAEKKKEKTN